MKGQRYKLIMQKEESFNYKARQVNNPSVLAENFDSIFGLSQQAEEILALICFDAKLRIIGAFEVSRGALSQTVVSPREIFKRAVLCNAHSFAIAHNHPSGDPNPSKEDHMVYKRLSECGDMLGVECKDALVIGDGRYYSHKGDEYNLF